jgi:hypothetical protein
LIIGTGTPEDPGLYCCMLRGGWKVLEWSEKTRTWHYPGLDVDWLPADVSKWIGPLDPEAEAVREYDL